MTLSVEALDHLVINVKDVETAAAWYERVLGMKRVVIEPRPGRKVTSMHSGGRRSTCGRTPRPRSSGSPAARSRPAAMTSAS
jgi:catechol 2,3-dioxygenase-like lactoylglutathione lyase family enzyme